MAKSRELIVNVFSFTKINDDDDDGMIIKTLLGVIDRRFAIAVRKLIANSRAFN